MKSSKALRLLSLAGISTLLSQPLMAQDYQYYYWGLSAGQSHSQMDPNRTVGTLLGTGMAFPVASSNMQDNGYKVFGGHQFSRNFGVELGYFNLGKFSYGTSTALGPLNGKYNVEGLNLDLVGTIPLSERWSALARLGGQYASTRSDFSGTGLGLMGTTSRSKEDSNMKVGLGLQYEISNSLFLRGEAERYRINDGLDNRGDINHFSLSLVMPLGRAARTRPAVTPVAYVVPTPAPAPPPPAPVYVAPAPILIAPAPVPAPAPAPMPRRVQFSADSLFSFDKGEMRPDGKAALDTFANELRGTRFNTISVEGNTDRLGSEAYNQKLSEQRALAVKAYLINTAGMDASRISALGKGESNPVTKPEDCKGSKATPALIACLQPDRRVDVEVVGER